MMQTNAPLEPFLLTSSRELGGVWRSRELDLREPDPPKMYTMEAPGVTVVLTPLPSSVCEVKPPPDPALGSYRVDLSYHTASRAAREASKRKLLSAARAADRALRRWPPLIC
jgi:hypothetical protein